VNIVSTRRVQTSMTGCYAPCVGRHDAHANQARPGRHGGGGGWGTAFLRGGGGGAIWGWAPLSVGGRGNAF